MTALAGHQAGAGQLRIAGSETTLVCEEASGRIAVLSDGKVEVFESPALFTPVFSFSVPFDSARLVDFRGDLLVLSLTTESAEHWAALSLTGEEWLIWPNQGIGERFPTGNARLTLDGGGLYQFLLLDEVVREELGIPAETPAGAGVIASLRFADERVAARFSDSFTDAVSLNSGEFVATLRPGGALRYAAAAKVLWKLDRPKSGQWQLHDVDPRTDSVIAQDGAGALRLVSLASGELRGRWPIPDDLGEVLAAQGLRDGRVLLLAQENRHRLAVVDLEAGRVITRDLLASAGEGGRDLGGFWNREKLDLSSAVEIEPGLLLVRGPEGWHEIRLP